MTKKLNKKEKITVAILVVILGSAAVITFADHHRYHAPKTARELACERAASAPKPSPHDAALEGQSIDAAICAGTFQTSTPAQSQQ